MPCSGIFSAEKQYNFYQKAEAILPGSGTFSTGKQQIFYPEAAQTLPLQSRVCAASG